jgi:OmpA-OmpF porin, OOP family
LPYGNILNKSKIKPMFRKIQLSLLFVVSSFALKAQTDAAATTSTPKNMWEFGIHAGPYWVSGDIPGKIGLGGGLHLRKALDYTFSIRVDADYSQAKGEASNGGTFPYSGTLPGFTNGSLNAKNFSYTSIAGSVQLVIALNNLRWTGEGKRKWSPYFFAGAGMASVNTKNDLSNGQNGVDLILSGTQDIDKLVVQGEFGTGLAYRFNDRVNLAAEYKGSLVLGKRSDFIDGYDFRWRDFMNLFNLRLGINLGSTANKSIPLWWINPMDGVNNDLAELKARPKLDLTDTDGDGVIDMLDKEMDSPKGAPVDTRGIALDSDGDKILDYMDKEVYSPAGFNVDAQGIAQVPKPAYTTEADVNKIVDKKLAGYTPSSSAGSIADWFLPIIHFDFDKSNIKTSEFEELRQVATVLKNNSGLRVAVTGHTDRKASDNYNQGLSYRRAQAAIDHIVSVYGISRDRLVLTYASEADNLVKTNDKNYMNRRVEFKVATTETEMGSPSGSTPARTKFKGNKNSGY